MLSDRVKGWLRKWLSKSAGEDDPMLPPRFDEVVLLFAENDPLATVGDWVAFAQEHGRACYSHGFLQGLEHAERNDNDFPVSPVELADAVDPGWRHADPVDLTFDPDAVVPRNAPADHEVVEKHVEIANRVAAQRDPLVARARRW